MTNEDSPYGSASEVRRIRVFIDGFRIHAICPVWMSCWRWKTASFWLLSSWSPAAGRRADCREQPILDTVIESDNNAWYVSTTLRVSFLQGPVETHQRWEFDGWTWPPQFENQFNEDIKQRHK